MLKQDTDTNRFRRGLGPIFKSITGKLGSSDGKYYSNYVDTMSRIENKLENLMKNEILVTSVIKNFNNTIQNLQIDKQTFTDNLKVIQQGLYDISDDLAFYEAQLKLLVICETLTENYTLL